MHRNQPFPLLAVMISNANALALAPATLRRAGRAAGFTLIELMVTLAIAALLLVVAVPGFIDFRKNANLSDAVSNLVLAGGTAKAAALKSGRNAYVAVNDSAQGWTSGWYVFVDNNWDQAYDSGDEVVLRHDAVSSDITVSAPGTTTMAAGYFRFSGSGYPKLNTTAAAGTTASGTVVMANSIRSSTVVLDTAGRLRSCKTGSAGCSAS